MPSEKPCILLARPQERLADDLAVCELAGWHGIGFSPIELVTDKMALQQLQQSFQTADAVFWVSPSAVELAQGIIDNGKPQIAVGQTTAKALAKRGFSQILCPEQGNDSEAVAKLPLWQTLLPQSRIIIVRGHGGRDWLGQFLQNRKFNVSYAEIYQRVKQHLDWQLFSYYQPRAIWVASSEAAQEIFNQVPSEMAQDLQSLLYLTHHARIATVLQLNGVKRIELIKTFNLSTLQRYTELDR